MNRIKTILRYVYQTGGGGGSSTPSGSSLAWTDWDASTNVVPSNPAVGTFYQATSNSTTLLKSDGNVVTAGDILTPKVASPGTDITDKTKWAVITAIWGTFDNSFDPTPYFNVLNLQSNNAGNFVLSGGNVSQWTDLSGNNNHAVQATSGSRPAYNSGAILFDGSDDNLALTNEVGLTTHSIYILCKKNAVNTVSAALFGAIGPGNNFFRLDGNDFASSIERQITYNMVDRPPTANFTGVFRYGFEEVYEVIGFRRSGGTIAMTINDRESIMDSLNANTSNPTFVGFIGSANAGLYYPGVIKAFTIGNMSVNNTIHGNIVKWFYDHYAELLMNQEGNEGIGDSNMRGGAIVSSFPSMLYWVSTKMGVPYANLGISGQTSLQVSARIQAQTLTRPLSQGFIIAMVGTNDITNGRTAAQILATIEGDIQGLIAAGKPARKIVWLAAPYQYNDTNGAVLQAIENGVVAFGTTYNIRTVALYTWMKANGGNSLIGDAGVHLTVAAQQAVGEGPLYTAMQGA